jgi:hypothetical protein
MNIFEKLQKIKLDLVKANLKKSGNNRFSGFKYYELSDFMPHIIRLCEKYKVCTVIRFNKEFAELLAFDSELEGEQIPVSITSPIEKLEIRGANAVQAIGGTQTYIRRYLYMAMFDITENDTFDSVQGNETLKKEKEKEKPKEKPRNISIEEKDELKKLIGSKEKMAAILKHYHVNYLIEMTIDQFEDAKRILNKSKNVQEECKNAV